MNVSVKVIYVDASRLPPSPYFMVERPLARERDPSAGIFRGVEVARAGNYAVPHAPDFQIPESWAITRTGEHVRVPLLSYRTGTRSAVELVQLGLGLATSALAGFTALGVGEPRRLLVIMGSDVCEHAEPSDFYSVQVGLAVVFN